MVADTELNCSVPILTIEEIIVHSVNDLIHGTLHQIQEDELDKPPRRYGNRKYLPRRYPSAAEQDASIELEHRIAGARSWPRIP